MGDGSPHARGHWEGERWGTGGSRTASTGCLVAVRLVGRGRFETCPYLICGGWAWERWVPASARTTGVAGGYMGGGLNDR